MPKAKKPVPIRRSSRVHLRIPAIITGKSSDGRTFRQEAYILSVSKYGASLETAFPLEAGMIVSVQPTSRDQSAQFRVVWVGGPGSSRSREVGVECLDVVDLLGVSFPD